MSYGYGRAIPVATLLFAFALNAAIVDAQYFGRNKVQYEQFDFQVLRTEHFDVHYYPEEEQAVRLVARLAERWHTRLSRLFHHELRRRQPLILYASHPHFEQTNAIPTFLGEGTGGVTEPLKRRIVMPLAGPLAETDHVLGHELVHAFQYDIAGIAGPAMQFPLWFIEGMAEYLSLGPRDPHTAMWMRDALARDKLPSIDRLNDPRLFPYRYGHALWAYIAGRFGDEAVGRILRAGEQARDPLAAIEAVVGVEVDTLSKEWHAALREQYGAHVRARANGLADARVIVNDDRGGGEVNVGPALSPDGRKIIFLSERSLFDIEMFLVDVATGRTERTIVEMAVDPHFEGLQFIHSAGSWDPEGRRFAFAAVRKGQPVIGILDVGRGAIEREIALEELGEIFNPTWSPDGRAMAFAAIAGGTTDLFVYDLMKTDGGGLRRLTTDAYAELQPAWSPDGRRLAFATDRFSTRLSTLDVGPYQLAVLDVASGDVRPLTALGEAKAINPQWSVDGSSLYFLSDRTGATNVFRLDLATTRVFQVTDLATGVSGITATSPALSVAESSGLVAFSVFHDDEYAIYGIDRPETLAGRPVTEVVAGTDIAFLPPRDSAGGAVAQLLREPTIGLPETTRFTVNDYRPRLALDYVGQPYIVSGADRFGTFVGGGISFLFSDMLGDHQLATQVQVNGGFEDVAGQAGYMNLKSRWNWGAVVSQIPYLSGTSTSGLLDVGGGVVGVEEFDIFRETHRLLAGVVAYPFDRTKRLELTGGLRHISLTRETETVAFSLDTGEVLAEERRKLPGGQSISLGEASAAFVHDSAHFGPTSPILGRRYRFEVAPTMGSLFFSNLLADFRQYVMPFRPLTIAGRLLHAGRYGRDADTDLLAPLFLGYPNLVRGYDIESFSAEECGLRTQAGCPALEALIGSRMLVGNLELRFPIVGLFKGQLDYGPIPLEGVIFTDAGVAWNRRDEPSFLGGRREIVRSVGAGIRVNAFGYAILEFDAVRPLDRPHKGWMFAFALRPGF